jgi:hypothetical protein
MAFPRPVRPSVAWADLRSFLRTRSPHKIGFAAAAIVIPLFWIALFYIDEEEAVYRQPEITWIKTYDPKRTNAQIIAQQKIDTAARKKEEAERNAQLEAARAPFKKLDKQLDKMGL